jgi:hypothetical protein
VRTVVVEVLYFATHKAPPITKEDRKRRPDMEVAATEVLMDVLIEPMAANSIATADIMSAIEISVVVISIIVFLFTGKNV